MTIEKINSIDQLDQCAALLVDAYNGEPWNDSWTQEKALEKLQCFFHSPKFRGWVAIREGVYVGCCVGNIEPYYTGDYFYLKEMFVPGKYQHAGIGSHLFQTIKNEMKEEKIEMMILFTSNESFPFTFWEKQGFNAMEEMKMMGFGDGGQ